MPRVTEGGPRGEMEPVWTADVGEYVTALSVSPDGRSAAVGAASGELVVLALWEPGRTRKALAWGFVDDPVSGLAFSASAKLLVVASASGQVAAFPAP